MKTLNKAKFRCFICGKWGQVILKMMVGDDLSSCFEHIHQIVEMDRELAIEEEKNYKKSLMKGKITSPKQLVFVTISCITLIGV